MIWIADRNREQGELVAETLRAAEPVPREHSAIIVGGLPGAPKDAVLEGNSVDRSRYLTISIDRVLAAMAACQLIPEVAGRSPLAAADLVHDEAQYVAKRIALAAVNDGWNVILDVSLASRPSAESWAYALRFADYAVTAMLADISIEDSVAHSLAVQQRGEEEFGHGRGYGGRHIPAEAIRAHADVGLLDLDLVAKQTRETGHSTMGLIRALREILPGHAREWVYYGATVQDLSDTWFALVFRAMGDIAERDVTRMRDRALELADEYRDTPMCGRTHGQPGLPITFGFKAAVWAAELDRHLERLGQGRARWEVVQLGGALGSMEFWGDRALGLLDAFAGQLGLGVPVVPWITARDGVAEFAWLLAAISATAGKIGNEVYQLQRPEIGELRESFTPGTVGSITMPHKRNPEISEHLVTLSRVIRAQAAVALDGMMCEHERDGRAWKAEWLMVPETSMAFAACVGSAARMLDGLSADPARMLANIGSHRGYLLSEPVMRALADRLGKHSAHDSVYAAAMRGIDTAQDFRTALREDARLDAITDAELDELLVDLGHSQGSDDVEALMALDARVHRFIYRCADNPYLEETLARYFNLSLRIWHLVLDRLPHLFARVHEHDDVLHAIAAGDSERARAVLEEHIATFEREIRTVL